MKTLSKDAFQRAQKFLINYGRDLDRRRYAYHFGDGTGKLVLDALSMFQNQDGGFGHGLEADLRTPVSSVIATSHAFLVFREVRAKSGLEMVQNAVQYLLDQYDAQRRIWPMLPQEADATPHPWWWNYERLEETFDGFLVNPRARIIGHLWDYPSLVSRDFLHSVTRTFLDHFQALPNELGMYDLLSSRMLLDSSGLPEEYSQPLQSKLELAIPISTPQTADQIQAHGATPLFIAPSPESQLYEAFSSELVDANLDWLIDSQSEDGSWDLGWSWAEVDAQLWVQAEKDWKGAHIVDNLLVLRDFGRLEFPL
jgi:hypothetical protein